MLSFPESCAMGVNYRRNWKENEYRIDWILHLFKEREGIMVQTTRPLTGTSPAESLPGVSVQTAACTLLELLLSEALTAVCLLPCLCLSYHGFQGNVSMWSVSGTHRPRCTFKSWLLCLSTNLPYYTQVLALIMLLLRNSRVLQRPTPKTHHVLNLSQDSQRVGTGSLQVSSDGCTTVLSVKIIMAHALFFLRALQFLFIIFCTHLYNEQCLASHHLHTKKLFVCL